MGVLFLETDGNKRNMRYIVSNVREMLIVTYAILVDQNCNDSRKNLQMWVYYIPNSASEF